jgi:sugar-specific transcriptional regulator TrmB/predicted hydrocarbon binding protein
MNIDPMTDVINRLVEGGLEEKFAKILTAINGHPPLKASEIGRMNGISRMDAYNSLKKLQDKGLVKVTMEKPMRFTGIPITDIFKQLIKTEEAQIRRLQQHLDDIQQGNNVVMINPESIFQEPTFTVLKDRHNIMATFENVISESEESIWLTLGKWGILHILRSGAGDALTEAVERGVIVKIMANVNSNTIRFFDQLDDRIEIRHLDHMGHQGAFVDQEVGIQFVNVEAKPTGRGKEDTALLIESIDFLNAELELIGCQWATATAYIAARARLVDGMITEPLQLTIGQGSFYQRLQNMLDDKEGVGFTNAILRRPNEIPSMGISESTLNDLGVDMSAILRTVGQRIGRELALELREVVDDALFWTKLAIQWNKLGMGNLEIDSVPPKVVTVKESSKCETSPAIGSVLCHMDEGVLEGILKERHGVDVIASERACTSKGQDHCLFELLIEQIQ